MIAMAPLLALGEGAIIAIIVVLTIIAQLIAKWREMQAMANKPNAGQPNPARPKPAPGNDPLADEIGEFLRRATQRRGQAGQQPKRAGGAPPARAQEGRRTRSSRPGRTEQPAQPIPVEAEPADESVAEHVQEHLKSTFKRINPELGTEVAEADDKIEARLHQVFDHRVSLLSTVPGEAARPPAADQPGAPRRAAAAIPLAAAVAGIFANPATVSQAILIHEILRRPEERWG